MDRRDRSGSPRSGPSRSSSASAGGIAAYKACELLRLFTESGPRRHASCPTAAALEFVGRATWEALWASP